MFKKLLLFLSSFLLASQSTGYYPRGKDLLYPHTVTADTSNWCATIQNAPEKTTVLLKDGIYVGTCKLRKKKYLTIKAEHKWGVKYQGSGYFIECVDKNAYIHLLGIEASAKTWSQDSGLFKMHGYQFYNHHAYIADCWMHDMGGAIMTGPTVHDVTVDKCLIHDIKTNYYWYALGWHLVLSNSIAYHPENDGMMCRGHYPVNKRWAFGEVHDVRKDTSAKNIPSHEWTHRIVNNTFGKGYGREAGRSWDRGAAISFYIGWNDDKAEASYFPPQNVLIENNTFYNITPSHNKEHNITIKGAITINAGSGFPQVIPDVNYCNRVGVIKGTVIKNNTSNGKLLKEFWNPNLKLIMMENNKEFVKMKEPKLSF